MHDYPALARQLDGSGEETCWFPPASRQEVITLETLLDLRFPDDLIKFLMTCGGGGVVESAIGGIADDDASIAIGGTIHYNTVYCRAEFQLPSHLAVIYLHDDEVCWAVDCHSAGGGAVVSYNVFQRRIENTLANSFFMFFKEYVELRC
ncbi:SMI1/KNR4 family protein [Pseudomonas purpurea]|uniref:SMI1/KNR4 family protein n=1 Tax=Pseudomonas purpurea TaxID=3136737 RepID=UPI0032672B93